MKEIQSSQVTNIADMSSKVAMMRETVALLETRPDLGFVLLTLVAAFIDGLAKGAPGKTRVAYIDYLKNNFPELCLALGAEVFYAHIRNAAIHEFAPRPPIALAHESELMGQYAETRELNGEHWTVLNVDKIVTDFKHHLDKLTAEGTVK